MKNFFLMGKGDFIQHLFDNMKEELSKQKHQIYEHSLDGYISEGLHKCFGDFKMDAKNEINNNLNEKKMMGSSSNNFNSFRANIVDRLLAKKV
jgi:hypothetical protein